MYGTRIPAVNKYLAGQPLTGHNAQEQMQKLPAEVRWKADNYNHLFEQYATSPPIRFRGTNCY